MFKQYFYLLFFSMLLLLIGCATNPPPLTTTISATNTKPPSPTQPPPSPTAILATPTHTPLPATLPPTIPATILHEKSLAEIELSPLEKATRSWTPYDDHQLNFTIQLPPTWTSTHNNGTTILTNNKGLPQIRLRKYPSRNGLLSAETIAHWSLPPSIQSTLILTSTTLNLSPALLTNTTTTFIDGAGHYLAFEILVGSAEADLRLQTLTIRATHSALYHLYYVVSSEHWLAERKHGDNDSSMLTLQQRDNTMIYTLDETPAPQGLGYTLATPLFFDPSERYFYYNDQGVADGCGIYFGGEDLQQVELSNGTQITLKNTNGIGHTLSPDGHTVAFLRQQVDNQFTLHFFDLLTQTTETIDLSLEGESPKAGNLVFSPNGQRLAFTTLLNACSGGAWVVGTIDLISAEITTHYTGTGYPWLYPVAWWEDAVLIVGESGSAEYRQLDLQTNTLRDN